MIFPGSIIPDILFLFFLAPLKIVDIFPLQVHNQERTF